MEIVAPKAPEVAPEETAAEEEARMLAKLKEMSSVPEKAGE
jgi:hypothetical protein